MHTATPLNGSVFLKNEKQDLSSAGSDMQVEVFRFCSRREHNQIKAECVRSMTEELHLRCFIKGIKDVST